MNSSQTKNPGSFGMVILWILIAIYAYSTAIADAIPALNTDAMNQINTPLSTFSIFLFALIHGARRYGVRGIFIFLAICLVVSIFMENVGVITGFPFGHYYYTDLLGPKIYKVPFMVCFTYFGNGYLAWVLANVLLDNADNCQSRSSLIGMPVIAAFIMVSWDVCIDPTMSTVMQGWIWQKGGGYFGVPFVNYLGWYLTVYVFYQLFALYLARHSAVVRHFADKAYWYQAVIFFLILGISFLTTAYGGGTQEVKDQMGMVWRSGDIYTTGAIIALVTIIFTSILALFKIARRVE